MKFSVPVSELQKVFGSIGSVIPARSTLPILENFLFDQSGNTLRITATDLDTSVSSSIKVKGMKDGRIAVPAKRIMETVRALSAANITFTADLGNSKISIVTENGEYKLTGEASENYPTLPEIKSDTEFTVASNVLKRLIANTVFAVSSDELRPAMTGLFFQIGDKEVRTVSTDGHRLIRMINKNISSGKTKRELIVPAKAMHAVAKSLDAEECTIHLDEKHILFTFDGTEITSRLIEEKYPNYESVIPGDNDKKLIVPTSELLASIRRTSLYASSATHQVRLSLSKNSLMISAEDADLGSEAKETVRCDYTADAMEIGFNAGYLVDVLGHIDTPDTEIYLSNPTRAIIIQPGKQQQGENLIMLVMPVRLSS